MTYISIKQTTTRIPELHHSFPKSNRSPSTSGDSNLFGTRPTNNSPAKQAPPWPARYISRLWSPAASGFRTTRPPPPQVSALAASTPPDRRDTRRGVGFYTPKERIFDQQSVGDWESMGMYGNSEDEVPSSKMGVLAGLPSLLGDL